MCGNLCWGGVAAGETHQTLQYKYVTPKCANLGVQLEGGAHEETIGEIRVAPGNVKDIGFAVGNAWGFREEMKGALPQRWVCGVCVCVCPWVAASMDYIHSREPACARACLCVRACVSMVR